MIGRMLSLSTAEVPLIISLIPGKKYKQDQKYGNQGGKNPGNPPDCFLMW